MSKHQNALTCLLLASCLVGTIAGVALGAGAGQMSGGAFSLVVKPDGIAWAWGQNDDGQLGDGSTQSSDVPVFVGPEIWSDKFVVAVASGENHSVAVAEDINGAAAIYAWGSNAFGQIGNGSSGDQAQPVLEPVQIMPGDPRFTEVIAVAAGANHSLALLRATGNTTEIWAWGRNAEGQLGLSSTSAPVAVPTQVMGFRGITVRSIAAGDNFSLALDNQGRVYAWGDNSFGQLADADTQNIDCACPLLLPSLQNIDAIAAGGGFAFAWRTNDDGTQQVWSWGRNNEGQLGLGAIGESQSVPQLVTRLTEIGGTIEDIQAGQAHALALIEMPDGAKRVYIWGSNANDQLASDDFFYSSIPVLLSGVPADVVEIGVGENHSMVRDSKGLVWTWGSDAQGQLGHGQAGGSANGQPIPNFRATGIPAAGRTHSLALVAADGEGENVVWSWGDNASGQLGIPLSIPSAAGPVAIDPARAADQVAAGGDHSLALAGSEVWAWGRNAEGQLGLGNANSPVPAPTRVQALNGVDIQRVDAGESFSVALTETGAVYTWGDNTYGQLGDPARGSAQDPPAAVAGLERIDGIAAGGGFVLAWRTSNGGEQEVWSWGRNNAGQLGTGGFGGMEGQPQEVTALAELGTIMDIQAGQTHALAQIAESNGAVQVYAWGDNFQSQLGNDEVFYSVTPRLVPGLPDDMDAIAAGYNHNLALTRTGRLYGWGDNTSGQLGIEGADQVVTPVEIPLPSGTTVMAIAAGGDSSFVWTNTGEVLVWGAQAGEGAGGPIQPVDDFPATLILLADPADGGSVRILQGEPVFGEQITVTAVPAEGYRLDRWSGTAVDEGLVVGSPAENPVTFILDRDSTLQANFVRSDVPGGRFTLTTSVRGDGSVTRSPNTGSYVPGTRVTVTATPDEHNRFAGWEGSGADLLSDRNDPNASFTITRSVELTAVFEPNVYTLTISARGDGTTDPEPGDYEFEFRPGATQAVSAIPDPNAQFIRWAGTAVERGKVADPTGANTTVEIDGDYTLIARFTGAPFEIVDPNLRTEIARQIGVAEPNEEDMTRLTRLVLPDAGITDLTGIEAAVNLDALGLQRNQISDIGPLTELPALRALSLEGNPLNDAAFDDISRLTDLVELNLRNTNDTITDIPSEWITNLTRLRILDLRGNQNLRLNDPNIRELKRLVEARGGSLAVD